MKKTTTKEKCTCGFDMNNFQGGGVCGREHPQVAGDWSEAVKAAKEFQKHLTDEEKDTFNDYELGHLAVIISKTLLQQQHDHEILVNTILEEKKLERQRIVEEIEKIIGEDEKIRHQHPTLQTINWIEKGWWSKGRNSFRTELRKKLSKLKQGKEGKE